jgi:WD40 repeat protein
MALSKAFSETSQNQDENVKAGQYALLAYQYNKKAIGYESEQPVYTALLGVLQRYNRFPQTLGETFQAQEFVQKSGDALFSVADQTKILKWTWESTGWKSDVLWTVSSGVVSAMAINDTGDLIAIAVITNKNSYRVDLYDLNDPKVNAKIFTGFQEAVTQIEFSLKGKGFYSLDKTGTISFCESGVVKEVIKIDDRVLSIDLRSDGEMLIGIGVSGYLYYWETDTFSQKRFQIAKEPNLLCAVSFMPDAEKIIVGDKNGRLVITDLVTKSYWRELRSYKSSPVNNISFSGSGQIMATASRDKTIKLWNLKELNRPPIIITLENEAKSTLFFPEDNLVLATLFTHGVTGKEDRSTISILPVTIERMAKEVCELVGTNLTAEEWSAIVPDILYEPACPD